jgi:hypothetical protein
MRLARSLTLPPWCCSHVFGWALIDACSACSAQHELNIVSGFKALKLIEQSDEMLLPDEGFHVRRFVMYERRSPWWGPMPPAPFPPFLSGGWCHPSLFSLPTN